MEQAEIEAKKRLEAMARAIGMTVEQYQEYLYQNESDKREEERECRYEDRSNEP